MRTYEDWMRSREKVARIGCVNVGWIAGMGMVPMVERRVTPTEP
jgi:hypothetical protein